MKTHGVTNIDLNLSGFSSMKLKIIWFHNIRTKTDYLVSGQLGTWVPKYYCVLAMPQAFPGDNHIIMEVGANWLKTCITKKSSPSSKFSSRAMSSC